MPALALLLPFQVHSFVVLIAATDAGLGAADAFLGTQSGSFKSRWALLLTFQVPSLVVPKAATIAAAAFP
jgi:hypothetical protein